ncbi:MAG: ABC transporter substrate-binding protein [Ruminococcaceae bacterium]|nr:ABC transporter substrate-binding protein [Oscillospiraceae bacterium]
MKARKILSILLIALLVCLPLFTSCNQKAKYTVGICQLVQHPALDSATKGFKDALTAALGEDVAFDEQNAAGSSDTCSTIVSTFVTKKVDLIMANATGALQAAQNATTEIPILGTSITEYGVALGIDNFSGTVGGNISGTSDLAPLDKQAQMILDLVPTAKTVGLLYCSSEPNSAYQVKVVKEYLEGKSITCKDFKFSDANDVQLIAQNAATECDAIYIPTDNTAADNAEAIWGAVSAKKTPIIAGESGICSGCGIATLSIDYYDLGYKTGEMAAKILKGEADIATMPIEYTPEEKLTKLYNKEICEAVGIDTAKLESDGYTAIQK